MDQPKVSLVVVQKERFSYTQKALESIYDNTQFPFELIYVDGNSPAHVHNYLECASEQYGFKLIRKEQFLFPNQARNIGLQEAKTDFVVFIDNDVLVSSGWLTKLMDCEARTQAAIIVPLCMEGEAFDPIHQAGGKMHIKEIKDGRRWLIEKRPYMRLPLTKLSQPLVGEPTEIGEFHCVFAQRKLFEKIGLLDEQFMGMAEDTDFFLSATQANQLIYFEPTCVVSYVLPNKLNFSDLPFFFTRWNDNWCLKSVNRLQQKYNLSSDAPILRRYENFVAYHRHRAYFGMSHQLSEVFFSKKNSFIQKIKYCYMRLIQHRIERKIDALPSES